MHRSEAERLEAAWNAFSRHSRDGRFRVIPLTVHGCCHLYAGRHFPDGEEAILVGFPGVPLPGPEALPQGNGFMVDVVEKSVLAAPSVALARRPHASVAMFTMMAADVVAMLDRHAGASEKDLLHLFLGRIRGWQDFMDRGSLSMLGPDAELGLFGELVVLRRLLEADLAPMHVLDAWHGPLRGLHDFVLGRGAIEVKTTTATHGFPARVQSLEQFDEAVRRPLFCCAVRLTEAADGRTLPDQISAVADVLDAAPLARGLFETRLIQADYLTETADRYTRRFTVEDVILIRVAGDFPRLTASTVPAGVTRARYEVDLDLVNLDDVGLRDALGLFEGE